MRPNKLLQYCNKRPHRCCPLQITLSISTARMPGHAKHSPTKVLLPAGKIQDPSNAWFLGSTGVHITNGTLIGSSVFAGPCSRQITTPPPHHSVFLQAGCPSCRPTNSVKALKETWKQKYIIHHVNCTTQMHSSIGKHCTQPYSMPKCNKCNYRKSKWPPVTGEPAEIYINRTFWRQAKQIIEIGTEN